MSTTLDAPSRRKHLIGALAVTCAVFAGLFAAGSPAEAAAAKPSASNTGAPAGTTLAKYAGPLIITVDGTVIDKKAVYGDLKIRAKNVIIRNSYLHCGSDNPTASTGCIDANHGNVYNLQVTNNTIRPDRPSYYRDGIIGHEFTARYNHISHTNDGLGIFNKPGGSVYANVTAEYNYIHDLAHFNYSPSQSDGTHNDGIQVQGGKNIAIRYNTVIGSVYSADGGSFKYGTHGNAALMVTPNVSQIGTMVVEGNWFDNGQTSVGITNGKFSTVTLTLQNNRFGRNQYDYGSGSKCTIRIYNKAASSINGLWTNRWEDNTVLLTEGRTGGVRYG